MPTPVLCPTATRIRGGDISALPPVAAAVILTRNAPTIGNLSRTSSTITFLRAAPFFFPFEFGLLTPTTVPPSSLSNGAKASESNRTPFAHAVTLW